jgi:hypothetical protein
MDRDHQTRELVAWGAHLHQQHQRLVAKIATLLGRLAQTEQHVAETFERRAWVAPHRADQLRHSARAARACAHRLRSKHARLRQATLPDRRDERDDLAPDDQRWPLTQAGYGAGMTESAESTDSASAMG